MTSFVQINPHQFCPSSSSGNFNLIRNILFSSFYQTGKRKKGKKKKTFVIFLLNFLVENLPKIFLLSCLFSSLTNHTVGWGNKIVLLLFLVSQSNFSCFLHFSKPVHCPFQTNLPIAVLWKLALGHKQIKGTPLII